MCLQGPAGYGKTHALSVVVRFLTENEIHFQFVSFTLKTAAGSIPGVNGLTFAKLLALAFGAKSQVNLLSNQKWVDNRIAYFSKILPAGTVIIVDEISATVGANLDTLDQLLQFTHNNTRPFGGLHVLLAGDFQQLPPIGPSPPCTDAEVFRALPIAHFVLDEEMRSAKDPAFGKWKQAQRFAKEITIPQHMRTADGLGFLFTSLRDLQSANCFMVCYKNAHVVDSIIELATRIMGILEKDNNAGFQCILIPPRDIRVTDNQFGENIPDIPFLKCLIQNKLVTYGAAHTPKKRQSKASTRARPVKQSRMITPLAAMVLNRDGDAGSSPHTPCNRSQTTHQLSAAVRPCCHTSATDAVACAHWLRSLMRHRDDRPVRTPPLVTAQRPALHPGPYAPFDRDMEREADPLVRKMMKNVFCLAPDVATSSLQQSAVALFGLYAKNLVRPAKGIQKQSRNVLPFLFFGKGFPVYATRTRKNLINGNTYTLLSYDGDRIEIEPGVFITRNSFRLSITERFTVTWSAYELAPTWSTTIDRCQGTTARRIVLRVSENVSYSRHGMSYVPITRACAESDFKVEGGDMSVPLKLPNHQDPRRARLTLKKEDPREVSRTN